MYKMRVDLENVVHVLDLGAAIQRVAGGYALYGYEFISPEEIYVYTSTVPSSYDFKYKPEYLEPGSINLQSWPIHEVVKRYCITFGEDAIVEGFETVEFEEPDAPYVIIDANDPIVAEIMVAVHNPNDIFEYPGENFELIYNGKTYIFDLQGEHTIVVTTTEGGKMVHVIHEDHINNECDLELLSHITFDDQIAKAIDETYDFILGNDVVDEIVDIVIKAQARVISTETLIDFASNYNILRCESLSPETVRVVFNEGKTSQFVLDDMISRIESTQDITTKFSVNRLREREADVNLIESVWSILSKDYDADFITRVGEFNVRAKQVLADLRSELINLEEEHKTFYESELNLYIDWDSLSAEAFKKERIVHLPRATFGQDDGVTYVSIEIGSNQDCWIREDLAEDYLETHCVNEHARKFLPVDLDYPFIIAEVNNQKLLIEALQ